MEERQRRWILFGVSLALVASPFLFVTYPPSTDLPQDVAQVPLLEQALHDPAGPYQIQWLTPHWLVTALYAFVWPWAGPANTGRIGLALLGVAWTASAHWLASMRRRSAEAAVLASLFFFNVCMYWGLGSFLVGWPVFVVWLHLTTRWPRKFERRDAVVFVPLVWLFYFSHFAWLLIALAWLVLSWVLLRPSRKVLLTQAALALPPLVLAVVCVVQSPLHRFVSRMTWTEMPWARLNPSWLAMAGLSGLPVSTTVIVVVGVLAWCVIGAWQHRASVRDAFDIPLLAAAFSFLLAALVLPSKYSYMVLIPERFVPGFLILLLVAVPSPRLSLAFQRLIAVGTLATFAVVTTMVWRLFDQTELDGLSEALAAVPSSARVLELDFLKESQYVGGLPFHQLAAYAQLRGNVEIGFSYADLPSPLVVYKNDRFEKRDQCWSVDLEFAAESVTKSDLRFFDYALIGAREDAITRMSTLLPVEAVTTSGRWRLFKIQHSAD